MQSNEISHVAWRLVRNDNENSKELKKQCRLRLRQQGTLHFLWCQSAATRSALTPLAVVILVSLEMRNRVVHPSVTIFLKIVIWP